MASNRINELVHRAQLKGVLLVEDSKGNWRAEYNHGGELWTLDSAQPEDVLDDMDALIETLTQDDLYAADFNEDLGKYLVSVNGVEKPFVADTLREAFAMAKASVLAKAKPAEVARRKFGKKAEPEPVEEVHTEPTQAPEATAKEVAEDEAKAKAQAIAEAQAAQRQRPTSPPVGVQPPGQGRREADLLPPALTGALVNLVEAMANLVTLISAQVPVAAVSNKPNGGANVKSEDIPEEFTEPAEPTTSPPPRRRAAAKRT